MSRPTAALEVMGPPEPVRFREPLDWNQVPFYFIVLALGLALAALGTFAMPELDGKVRLLFVVLLVPLAWLGWRLIGYLRERREFRFEADALDVPRLWLFGRPFRVEYAQVQSIDAHKGMRLTLKDGTVVRASSQSADASRILAAMQLRVGCALERCGRFAEAAQLFFSASSEHNPPLDARIAFALWRAGHGEPTAEEDGGDDDDPAVARVERAIQIDRQSDILTHLHVAAATHRAAFGTEHPMTAFLERAIERFRTQYPDAGVDQEEVAELVGLAGGQLQDRWR